MRIFGAIADASCKSRSIIESEIQKHKQKPFLKPNPKCATQSIKFSARSTTSQHLIKNILSYKRAQKLSRRQVSAKSAAI